MTAPATTRPGPQGFSGLAAWWVQRLSALYMLVFAAFLVATFALRPMRDYTQWLGWIGRPGVKTALLAFFAALFCHMWVGLRDVLLDYAKPPPLQRLLLGALGASLVAHAAAVVWILLPVSP